MNEPPKVSRAIPSERVGLYAKTSHDLVSSQTIRSAGSATHSLPTNLPRILCSPSNPTVSLGLSLSPFLISYQYSSSTPSNHSYRFLYTLLSAGFPCARADPAIDSALATLSRTTLHQQWYSSNTGPNLHDPPWPCVFVTLPSLPLPARIPRLTVPRRPTVRVAATHSSAGGAVARSPRSPPRLPTTPIYPDHTVPHSVLWNVHGHSRASSNPLPSVPSYNVRLRIVTPYTGNSGWVPYGLLPLPTYRPRHCMISPSRNVSSCGSCGNSGGTGILPTYRPNGNTGVCALPGAVREQPILIPGTPGKS